MQPGAVGGLSGGGHQPLGSRLVQALPGTDQDGDGVRRRHHEPPLLAGGAVLVEHHGVDEGRVAQRGQPGGQATHEQAAVAQVVLGDGRVRGLGDLGVGAAGGARLLLGLGPQGVPFAGDGREQVLRRAGDLVQDGPRAVDHGDVGQLRQVALQRHQLGDLLGAQQLTCVRGLREDDDRIAAEGTRGLL